MSNEDSSYQEWLELKVTLLSERVTDLEMCCDSRGTKLRVLKNTLDLAMTGKEIELKTWESIISWFTEENVPYSGKMVRVSGIPYKVPIESVK